jgi:hypothetical protein
LQVFCEQLLPRRKVVSGRLFDLALSPGASLGFARLEATLKTIPLVVFALLASLSACDPPLATDADESDGRSPIGKADLFGSCASSDCSGPAEDGNCYCDDGCVDVGDCCPDKAALCDAGCKDFAVDFRARIGSGSGFSEVLVDAVIPGTNEPDPLLGKVTFLTTEFRDYRIAIPPELALKDGLVLRFRGNAAQISAVRFTRNGVVDVMRNGNSDQLNIPRYYWFPVPTECEGSAVLAPQTPTTVVVDKQKSLRIDTPEPAHAFVWARVTPEVCQGTNTGFVRVLWFEDKTPGVVKRNTSVTTGSVLQDSRMTSEPGNKGTLWLTSSRGFRQDPDETDGVCKVELYLEYR